MFVKSIRAYHAQLLLYLVNEKILYSKQFGLQKVHSTEHAFAQLTDQIHNSFENGSYTLRVFIDLSKAFDTVDQVILLKSFKLMELMVQILPSSEVI